MRSSLANLRKLVPLPRRRRHLVLLIQGPARLPRLTESAPAGGFNDTRVLAIVPIGAAASLRAAEARIRANGTSPELRVAEAEDGYLDPGLLFAEGVTLEVYLARQQTAARPGAAGLGIVLALLGALAAGPAGAAPAAVSTPGGPVALDGPRPAPDASPIGWWLLGAALLGAAWLGERGRGRSRQPPPPPPRPARQRPPALRVPEDAELLQVVARCWPRSTLREVCRALWPELGWAPWGSEPSATTWARSWPRAPHTATPAEWVMDRLTLMTCGGSARYETRDRSEVDVLASLRWSTTWTPAPVREQADRRRAS